MSWTGSPTISDDTGRFVGGQAANESNVLQSKRAARVVAGRAIDAKDCAEILAMLGLDAVAERSTDR
jgi:hypothetical protein